jgi:hypothetical protein
MGGKGNGQIGHISQEVTGRLKEASILLISKFPFAKNMAIVKNDFS